jgi:uncharacterized protein (TIGR01777 family)
VNLAGLEGLDAVVHLAGENPASERWSEAKKARIRDSRVQGTSLLVTSLGRLERPPRLLVCASAIGYYGDRGDEILTEESPPGRGFLAGVCVEWEAAAARAAAAGLRVVSLRFGIVLTPAGDALQRMLGPFRMGMGGPIGSGRQYVSWIALDDALGAIHHALVTGALQGPVNAVSPEPASHLEFARALGRALGRPALVPVPTFAVRFMFGEMADEMLLASARVEPARLLATGYRFRFPRLEIALEHLLASR